LKFGIELNNLKVILRLARLHFLIPGFMLYVMGYLLALLSGVDFDLTKFVFGYLIFGAAHLSVSFSNDYFDRKADRNSIKTAFSGGSKVLVTNPEMEDLALKIGFGLLLVSIVANVFFTVIYGYSFWFFIFGLVGGLLGWFYTAPPLKLAYRGLGELATIMAVGLLMPGMGYFVASGTIGPLFQALILPLGCYGLFFIITVELPDVESDTESHKTNFLVKWGLNAGRNICVAATIMGTIFMITLLFSGTTEILDIGSLALFSLIPLISSFTGLLINIHDRKVLVRQVMINMASMILFLVLIDVNLFLNYTLTA
jgi:1,4-dihydroxy-2-naphthoate octaprenyltransferase